MCIDYRLRNIVDAEDATDSDDDVRAVAAAAMEFSIWHVLCAVTKIQRTSWLLRLSSK